MFVPSIFSPSVAITVSLYTIGTCALKLCVPAKILPNSLCDMYILKLASIPSDPPNKANRTKMQNEGIQHVFLTTIISFLLWIQLLTNAFTTLSSCVLLPPFKLNLVLRGTRNNYVLTSLSHWERRSTPW
jgi:hypothetical protein